MIPTDQTSIKIPFEKTVPVPAFFAEAADMSAGVTDPDVEGKTLTPKKLGQVSYFSRELLDDTPLALVNLLAGRISHALGELEDKEIIDGSGFTQSLYLGLAHAVCEHA